MYSVGPHCTNKEEGCLLKISVHTLDAVGRRIVDRGSAKLVRGRPVRDGSVDQILDR